MKTIAHEKKIIILHLLFIALLTIAIFSPMLKNSFTNWDDPEYILKNPYIKDYSAGNLKMIFGSFYAANYHPLILLSFLIEHSLFGLTPFYFHLNNLLLHVINSLLVYYFILLLSGRKSTSFIASLLFAIHPFHVESVAWITERKDTLSAFFFLLSLIFYLKNDCASKLKFICLSIAAYILGLLSKPMIVSLPLILILIDYFRRKQITIKTIVNKSPYFALSVIFGIVTIFAQHSGGALQPPADKYGIIYRAFMASYGFFYYPVKMFFPVNLSAFHPYPKDYMGIMIPAYYYILPFCLAIIIFLIYRFHNNHSLIFGTSFYLVSIFLVLQLIPVGSARVAERYFYIPSIGVFFLIGEMLSNIYYTKSAKRKPLLILFITVLSMFVLMFSVMTFQRCKVWKNSVTLWNDALNQYPQNYYIHHNLGNAYKDEKNFSKALEHLSISIKLNQGYAQAYNNRGIVLINIKEYSSAIQDFNRAVELKFDYAAAYNNRGIAYLQQGQIKAAETDFRKAILTEPEYAEAYRNLGGLLLKMNRISEAMEILSASFRYDQSDPETLNNLGNAFNIMGQFDDALRHYSLAIKYKPDYAEAYFNRSTVYFLKADYDKAMKDVKQVEKLGGNINPDFLKKLKMAAGVD